MGRVKNYCSKQCTAYEVARKQKLQEDRENRQRAKIIQQKTVYTDEPIPKDWLQKAYCNNKPTKDFFPGQGDTTVKKVIQENCNNCEVKQPCLNYAIKNSIRYGIWGGTSERQRRSLRREYKKNLNLNEQQS
jgi:hypothetical protein